MIYPHPLIRLIEALRCLPGVGPKSAQRMAFHLLEKDRNAAGVLADALQKALEGIGPDELGFAQLETLLAEGLVTEAILATSTTVEGDATAHVVSEIAIR